MHITATRNIAQFGHAYTALPISICCFLLPLSCMSLSLTPLPHDTNYSINLEYSVQDMLGNIPTQKPVNMHTHRSMPTHTTHTHPYKSVIPRDDGADIIEKQSQQ